MKLTFTRHGESEANVQEVFWNQPEGYGLTEAGRAQAHALAGTLDATRFAALYASPVLRARQTAEILGGRLGLTPEIADGLREWHVGVIEGRTYADETRGLHRQAMSQWLYHSNYDARIEGGESYRDMVARFDPLIARLRDAYEGSDSNVLLVSHGGLLGSMLPRLLVNVDVDTALELGFSYATPIVAELRDGAWVCLRWGETSCSPP